MMTVKELQNYYANLLILQYIGKARARAHIKTLAGGAVIDLLPLDVRDGFNIDTAVGVQLDALGVYAGLSRKGFDFSGPVTLDDDDYRQALKLKIIQNTNGSSLADIQRSLNTFFENQIFVFDYLDMRMGYLLDASVGDQQLVEFFITQNLLPKPAAVQLSSTIFVDGDFFGYRTYEAAGVNNSPYNTYEDYQTDRPFLDYDDAI